MAGSNLLTGELATKSQRTLRDITDLFDQHGIRYCLEGGTLLGIVREQRLLPWDNDLDITVTADQFEALQACLKKSAWKYRVRTRFSFDDFGPMKKGAPRLIRVRDRKFLFFPGDVRLDIFVKHTDGSDYYWVVGGAKNHAVKSIPEKFYKELIEYEFDGKNYLIPKDYDEYLTLRYGDWREPVKEWNYLTDDKAKVAGKSSK